MEAIEAAWHACSVCLDIPHLPTWPNLGHARYLIPGPPPFTTEAPFDFAQGRLRTRRRNKAKSNRGLRGGRGSDFLCALRPTACAHAFGREEWDFTTRFPSDESLGLDMSALPGLTPRIPTPPTEGGMSHSFQD